MISKRLFGWKVRLVLRRDWSLLHQLSHTLIIGLTVAQKGNSPGFQLAYPFSRLGWMRWKGTIKQVRVWLASHIGSSTQSNRSGGIPPGKWRSCRFEYGTLHSWHTTSRQAVHTVHSSRDAADDQGTDRRVILFHWQQRPCVSLAPDPLEGNLGPIRTLVLYSTLASKSGEEVLLL